MMADQVIAELEAAAQILLASPNVISSEQRHCAESVFLNFQKTKSPFQLCQYILANSRSDYVQFQAASLLKQAVIGEWLLLETSELENVRVGLMNFVTQNPNLQSYVREQLLLVIAIMVKRATVDYRDGIDERNEVVGKLLTEVSQLISSGDIARQVVGCSILTALLNEFSSTTRASDMGLTWSDHLMAKKKFEKCDLKRLFRYCLEGLSELNKLGIPIPPDATKLFKKFLIIAEQVLTWNFQFAMLLPRKLIGLFESQQSPALRPNIEWREVFMDPNVLPLFFKLHWQVREVPDLCHHTLQCLNQLASLNGAVMNLKDDRCTYLSWFIENILTLLSSGPVKDYEALGIASFISRLQVFFPAVYMGALPAELLQAYVGELRNLACYFCECAAQEELLGKEDHVFAEAFDQVLEAWMNILQDSQHYPTELIKQSSIQIFNKYLQSHLYAPDGTRAIAKNHKDEIDEVEEDDRIKYCDQLTIIGDFGRQILEHCVPLLVRFLEDRVTRLHCELQKIHQQASTAENNDMLERLNEDIHWLVLISAHVLTSVSDGETSLIPQEVIHYCNAEKANIDMDITLRVLASPGHKTSDIPGAEQSTDPVIRLISAVFRLCEVEKRALEANFTHALSPQVALTLMWFISRFSVCYLLPNEGYYTQLSVTLAHAFGRDSEGGLWTLNFLINKIESNFLHWSSEPQVVIDSANALVVIIDNLERGDKALNCAAFGSLLQNQIRGAFQHLPTAAKRSLLRSLVLAGSADMDDDSRNRYWQQLLKPLQDRFRMVVCQDSFSQIQVTQFSQMYHHKEVRTEVLDLLECLIGVIDGCHIMSRSHLPYIIPMLKESVQFVDVYHNYNDIVGMVFQVFCTAAKRMLCFLNQADSKVLYDCCLNMIQFYAKHNAGKITREASAEEEQYQDVLVLMQLLTDLPSKDFIDFSSISSNDENNGEQESVSAADVALYGLSIIMPLMTTELLKFPSLCIQYFKLITFVCEICPKKIYSLPEDLFKALMSSVEWGLTSFTAEVSALCLDFLSVLVSYIHKSGFHGTPVHEALRPYLKIVMHMLIFEPLDSELTQVASTTLFTLICCYQDIYKEVVQSLINTQTDPTVVNLLARAFTKLMDDLHISLDRYDRIRFRDRFDYFISEVRGYLCVK